MLVARLEVLGEVDERGAVRFTVSSPTTLRGMDGKPIDVVVDNFSRTGFMFIAKVEFPPGTLVSVGLSGAGAREAKVVWRDGDRHGCEFLVPLPRSKMERAFRGQRDVVAAIEAHFGSALHAVETPGEEAAEPDMPRRRWTDALFQRLQRDLKD